MNVHEVVENYFPHLETIKVTCWSGKALIRSKETKEAALLIEELPREYSGQYVLLQQDGEVEIKLRYPIICLCCVMSTHHISEEMEREDARREAVLNTCKEHGITNFFMEQGAGRWSDAQVECHPTEDYNPRSLKEGETIHSRFGGILLGRLSRQ